MRSESGAGGRGKKAMTIVGRCPICDGSKTQFLDPDGHSTKGKCERCGNFSVTNSIIHRLKTLTPEVRAGLSGWAHDQNDLGAKAQIDSYNLDTLIARPIPLVDERASRLLSLAAKKQRRLGAKCKLPMPESLAVTYSVNVYDLRQLILYLKEQGFIEFISLDDMQVTVRGFAVAERLAQTVTVSSQGFVAMWFNPDLREAYSLGFSVGISNAGYVPLRIDLTEHNRKIDDEIIAQIKRSRFVVADFTGHRGGVYFEAGYALGRDMPVIWTCRNDYLDELHFDVRQFNCIGWDLPHELAERLQNRIEAVIGRGPRARALT